MIEFSLQFMKEHGLTSSQYGSMLSLSENIEGTAESMSHWVKTVKAMIGNHKYKKLKVEFEDYIKRDVGFEAMKENDIRMSISIYTNILQVSP